MNESPHEVATGVWVADVPAITLPPWTHTRAVVVADAGVGWLIDPGGGSDAAMGVLQDLLTAAHVRTLKGILLTHTHRDHVGGIDRILDAYKPLDIWVHPAGMARLDTRARVHPLEGGRRLMAGSRVIESVATPGHASDHLAFFIASSRALIAGDLVSGRGATWVGTPDGDVQVYLDSLARVAALDPALVIPAHGVVREDGVAVFKEARDHRLAREARVLDALASGPRTLEALRMETYSELPPAAVAFADRTLLAHLQKLMREARVMHAGSDSSGPFMLAPGLQRNGHVNS